MKRRVLDLIVCPRTRTPLTLRNERVEGDEIMSGELVNAHGDVFPIIEGVPRLLPDATSVSSAAQRTVDRFGEQWDEFDFMNPYYAQQFLGWIAPNTPETFQGKVVLEGGCGKGRHSALISEWGAKEVLALDLGSAVDTCFRNCRHLDNVHVIQADLFHLPVKPASVDVAFSVGVLHHTPNPSHCFRELVKSVREGGKVIAWVYGRENNGWIIYGVNPVRTAVTSRLPHKTVYQLAKVPAALILGLGRAVYQPLRKAPFEKIGDKLFYGAYISHISQFPYEEIHSIVHDHLIPPIAHYISRDVFESWFSALALEDVSITWHNENSWRGTGTVTAYALQELGALPPGSAA